MKNLYEPIRDDVEASTFRRIRVSPTRQNIRLRVWDKLPWGRPDVGWAVYNTVRVDTGVEW